MSLSNRLWLCKSISDEEVRAFTTRWLADAWRELRSNPKAWQVVEVEVFSSIPSTTSEEERR